MNLVFKGGGRLFTGRVAICCSLLVVPSGVFGAPRAEVDQALWNFGAVTNQAEVTHQFVIRNSGDAPLEISRVLSSCNACLRAGMEKTNIPPGGEAVLQSRLDLRLLSGAISRSILVDCNDPQKPSFPLELSGLVVSAYQIIPADISLDLAQGQTAATAEISPRLTLHADLSRVFCDDTNLEATVAPKPPIGFFLTVRVKENHPRGNTVARVTVRSAESNDAPCLVNVFIHHPPDLELIPERLNFQPRSEAQTRILWLKQHGAAPVTLLDAVPPSDKFHCEIDPDPAGLNYRIYVTAWQQETMTGQTNVLTLKFRDSMNQDKSITVPMAVE